MLGISRNQDDRPPIILPITIILYISSLFMPFFFVFLLQGFFFFSRENWYFTAPLSAYLSFAAGIIVIAISLTVYLIVKARTEKRIVSLIVMIGFLVSIPLFVAGTNNYYYLNDKGIHYHYLLKMDKDVYAWDEISKVKEVYKVRQGTTYLKELIFYTNDGSSVTLPNDHKYTVNRWKVTEKLEEYSVVIEGNSLEAEEE
ncbi:MULTISPECIES: hypothetical protein [unclassified Bacillus (in: firmicutes)]|uniref:hypothetical protein n=1 Tax=unclassified Bacillus (in: firmicutes) TaxID=185979 RepID=UPI0008E81E4A|nr:MULTISPECIES: hypothetical protein [unclassified Bacillus (in: firmicutes)]SFA91063.1 hypothetical protein SAMN02799634_102535 [Bacillus sp. UNCCL13]SFQ85481.1 hypothetical protein SAMN04488577_2655 [Bacillus sp. cl95]